MIFKGLHQCRNSRSFLTDGYIDAIHWFTSLIEILLVDDGIHGNGSLTSLSVTNDKLTLTSSNRNHGVDSLQACLQRFLYRLAIDNTRSLTVKWHLKRIRQIDISLTIDSLSQWIYYTTQEIIVHTNGSDTMRTLYRLSLFNTRRRT